MSPYEPIQPDIRRSNMCIADTRTIALIASKKNFNPDKERLLIEKAKKTVCKCHNWTGTEICMYRNCRHTTATHLGVGYNQNSIIETNFDYIRAANDIQGLGVVCHCGRKFIIEDISQHKWEQDGKIDTFAHCSKCLYDMTVCKFKNHRLITKVDQ